MDRHQPQRGERAQPRPQAWVRSASTQQALKGRNSELSRPFGARGIASDVPRPAAWALLSRPFGALRSASAAPLPSPRSLMKPGEALFVERGGGDRGEAPPIG